MMQGHRGLLQLPLALGTCALLACGPAEEVRSHEVVQWGVGFEAGPLVVGFESQDMARTSQAGEPRDLTLALWYPAGAAVGEPLPLGDLYQLVVDEGQLEEARGLSPERGLPAVMTGDSAALSVAESLGALSAPTRAFRDAAPAEGSFPLLLWSSRHATILAQAPMAESLASQGFVVATAWSSDPPLVFPWEDGSEADKQATVQEHAGDLGAVLDRLQDDPRVDADGTVLLSWSYGGQSAAILQERDPRVRAVVGLDANVLPVEGEASVQIKKPLVYFIGEDLEGRGFDRLDGLSTPWVALRLPETAHGNFNALEGYLPALFGSETVFEWSQGGEVAVSGYAALTRMVGEAARTFRTDSLPSVEDLAERLVVAGYPAQVELRHSNQAR
ncbi:MAG: hypothetical protein ACR2QM_17870 [Longimicrobiales bacterium]